MLMSNNKYCPCIDCMRREIGCHGGCQSYVDWKKKKDAIKAAIVAERVVESEYMSFNEQRKKRMRKYYG